MFYGIIFFEDYPNKQQKGNGMKVDIISNNNTNQNFKALKISKMETYPWNADSLEKFVKNKEVQKLVKIFHDKGKNVIAHYWDFSRSSNGIFIKLDLLDRDKDFNEWLGNHFAEIKLEELDEFNARNAIKAYEERESDKILSEEKMKDALSFVDKFNSSLDKKWYQFWK